jgi:hypothetical protein
LKKAWQSNHRKDENPKPVSLRMKLRPGLLIRYQSASALRFTLDGAYTKDRQVPSGSHLSDAIGCQRLRIKRRRRSC